jgi:hypothetical protein
VIISPTHQYLNKYGAAATLRWLWMTFVPQAFFVQPPHPTRLGGQVVGWVGGPSITRSFYGVLNQVIIPPTHQFINKYGAAAAFRPFQTIFEPRVNFTQPPHPTRRFQPGGYVPGLA